MKRIIWFSIPCILLIGVASSFLRIEVDIGLTTTRGEPYLVSELVHEAYSSPAFSWKVIVFHILGSVLSGLILGASASLLLPRRKVAITALLLVVIIVSILPSTTYVSISTLSARSLTLHSGFLYSFTDIYRDIGATTTRYGIVKRQSGSLTLFPVIQSDPLSFFGSSTRLELVRWGEREYVLSPYETLRFVAAIADQSEPRRSVFPSVFLLRQGDERIPVVGLPKLPQGFQSLLSDTALVCTVRGISDDGQVTVDFGRSRGALIGLPLIGRIFGGFITSFNETTSTVEVSPRDFRMQVGDTLATAPFWSREFLQ